MNFQEILLKQFKGQAPVRPLFMPDLGQWFQWHSQRRTLPEGHGESTLGDIASALNCPAWTVRNPWQLIYDGVEVTRDESETQRVIKYHTKSRVLSEVWVLGPDGDWWQKDYPVKDEDDLDAAEEIVQAMQYRLGCADPPAADPNPCVIEAVQVPRTPYSDALHLLVGFGGEGLMLLSEEEDRFAEFLAVLEEKRHALLQTLAHDLSSPIFLALDNLDGQFISPAVFKSHLASSYRKTCDTLHRHDKHLVVHIGGLCKHLLPLLAGCGIDVLGGMSGPPQSDASLAEARAATGPNVTLWGGIPQDYVMPQHELSVLIESIEEARAFAEADNRAIVGIADHVPVDAEFSRLKEISRRVNGS